MINRPDREMDDTKLNSEGQQAIRKVVQALPEDSLSMAWRSSLNEQLLQVAVVQKKKQRWNWAIKPVVGLSFAMALAGVVLFMPAHPHSSKPPTVANRGLESAIITDHHNSALLDEVSTAGLNASETKTEANPQDPDDGIWSESDVESL